MVLAGCMARRREPDCFHHGEKMATMHILGDTAPSAQNALPPHRCVRRDARQHDYDHYIQWRHGDNGHHKKRLTAFHERAGRIFYRPRTD